MFIPVIRTVVTPWLRTGASGRCRQNNRCASWYLLVSPARGLAEQACPHIPKILKGCVALADSEHEEEAKESRTLCNLLELDVKRVTQASKSHIQALLCWILPVRTSRGPFVGTDFGFLKPLAMLSIVPIIRALGKERGYPNSQPTR
jgi:hypothetical protein